MEIEKHAKIPHSLSLDVISRFMKEKEFKAFWKNYQENKIKRDGGMVTPPNELQYKIAKLRLEGKTPREISDKLNMTFSKVEYTLHRVATWEYYPKPKEK